MTKFIPDLTIMTAGGAVSTPNSVVTEQGVGPAQNVWPPNEAAGTPAGSPTSWTQAAWYIDPQNVSGHASDDNAGDNPSFPVSSYNGGIVAKWGTTSPTLAQNTTFTWLSSQPVGGADPVIFTPVMSNAIALLQAVLPAPFHTGILGGVVAKNRATATLLQATLGAPAPAVGVLVKNTTLGKESYAWVYKTGTPCTLSQPVVLAALPLPHPGAPVTVDTWANGDTFELYALREVNIVKLAPTIAAYVAPAFPNQVQVAHMKAATHDDIDGDDNFYLGSDTSLIEMSTQGFVISEQASSDTEFQDIANCFMMSGVDITAGANQTVSCSSGIILQPDVSGACSWSFFNDAIIDTTAASGGGIGLTIGSVLQLAHDVAVVENLYIAGVVAAQGVARFGFGGGVLWGPGTLDAVGSARLSYQGMAVATFQPGIALRLNQQTNANAFNPATGAWSGPISITQAHLDAAFGGGGFGGLAVNVTGASLTSQNTP